MITFYITKIINHQARIKLYDNKYIYKYIRLAIFILLSTEVYKNMAEIVLFSANSLIRSIVPLSKSSLSGSIGSETASIYLSLIGFYNN